METGLRVEEVFQLILISSFIVLGGFNKLECNSCSNEPSIKPNAGNTIFLSFKLFKKLSKSSITDGIFAHFVFLSHNFFLIWS